MPYSYHDKIELIGRRFKMTETSLNGVVVWDPSTDRCAGDKTGLLTAAAGGGVSLARPVVGIEKTEKQRIHEKCGQ